MFLFTFRNIFVVYAKNFHTADFILSIPTYAFISSLIHFNKIMSFSWEKIIISFDHLKAEFMWGNHFPSGLMSNWAFVLRRQTQVQLVIWDSSKTKLNLLFSPFTLTTGNISTNSVRHPSLIHIFQQRLLHRQVWMIRWQHHRLLLFLHKQIVQQIKQLRD